MTFPKKRIDFLRCFLDTRMRLYLFDCQSKSITGVPGHHLASPMLSSMLSLRLTSMARKYMRYPGMLFLT